MANKTPYEIVNSEIALELPTNRLCVECARNGIENAASYLWPGVALLPTPYCERHLERDKQRLGIALGITEAA